MYIIPQRNIVLISLLMLICFFSQAQDFVPNQILIKWHNPTLVYQKEALYTAFKAKKSVFIANLGVEQLILDPTSNQDVEDLIATYCEHPLIEYIEPNHILFPFDNIPNDPDFTEQWALHNTGQLSGTPNSDINALQAWDISTDCSNVVVGIVDSGVDWKHEDLAENIWQNLAEDADGDGQVIVQINGVWQFDPDDENGIDDDGNGYIDDFIGWDFLNDDNDPSDGLEHGTHVAGIIGAKGNNNIGVAGVCWEAQLAPLRFIGDNRVGTAFDAAAAIDYAVQMNMPLSNHSYGSYFFNNTLDAAIQNAHSNGHLIVAAAGNGGNDTVGDDNDITNVYPASLPYDNIIAVAASNPNDDIAFFSNYGLTTVDLAAPGIFIKSCFPNNNYGNQSGTSMAAPYVTGACALYKNFYPNSSYLDIAESIQLTTDVVPAMNGLCVSNGRLNLNSLLNYSGVPLCRYRDSLALVDLYTATNGSNWYVSWDLTTPINTWHGITLDAGQCVKWIDLQDNNLTGSLPISIGSFQQLEYLYLHENNITGNIPPELGQLTNLTRFRLQHNDFTGDLPSELGDMSSLEHFILHHNPNLTGNIPVELGQLTNLKFLQIHDCNLTGIIPVELSNLDSLKQLYLTDNQLVGSIPPEISYLNKLERLHLNYNNLSGVIPLELGNLDSLKQLHLNSNNLVGYLPTELSNLTKLTAIRLDNNNLSGCFPSTYSNFCGLATHNFAGNPNLPNGGDFVDFCNNGNGICIQGTCTVDDSLALVALYNATDGVNWTNTWDLTQPISTWYGVTLNANQCVYNIALTNNNLTGFIPPEIGMIESLNYLYLDENNLSGVIPTELGLLTKLTRTRLQYNNLSGVIPPEIGNMISLEHFILHHNPNLTGNIPLELSNLTSLQYLLLHGCNFVGNIPKELGILTDLRQIYLGSNQLSGTIPSEFGGLLSLERLRLSHNNLTGSIPSEIGNLYNLKELYLESNDLSGSVPAELSNLVNLNILRLDGNNFSGSFPTELNGLTNLTYLNLGSNNLTGSIPPTIGNFPNLGRLYLNNNNFSGNIPLEIGNLHKIYYLSLNDNNLTGTIPTELMNLDSLSYLYLGDNNLTGNIPSELGTLSKLEYIYLDNNDLSGSIPSSLGNLSQLTRLYLNGNNFNGCIPISLSNHCSLTNISISNNPNLPNGGDFDAFCATGIGMCEPGLVWPGDFNANGIVEINDPLYWGLAEGILGVVRPNAISTWEGQSCPDWMTQTLGIDNKHQDANGNGLVDAVDFLVFESNFGNSYTSNVTTFNYDLKAFELIPRGFVATSTYGYDLYIRDISGVAVLHGASVQIDLNALPVKDVNVDFSNSSLEPSHFISYYDSLNNRVSIALTRSDKVDKICEEPIANLEFIIEDDLPLDDPLSFYMGNGSTSNASADTIHAVGASSAFAIFEDLSIFTADSLYLQVNAIHERCDQLGRTKIDIQGGLPPYSIHWSTGHSITTYDSLSYLNQLKHGVYSVTVTDNNGISKIQDFEIFGQYISDYDEYGNPIGCISAACLPILLVQDTILTGTYHADSLLQSNGHINAQNNVIFKAGALINLDPGFEVELGTQFSAEIEICSGN